MSLLDFHRDWTYSIKTRPEAINKSLNSFANIYKVAPIIMKNVVVA